MTIKPLHDRVVIERIEAESKTAGGIIIPDNAKEKPAEGVVVAIGSGARDNNGKIQTPLIMFKRDSLEKNRNLGNKLDANLPNHFGIFEKKYSKKKKTSKKKSKSKKRRKRR